MDKRRLRLYPLLIYKLRYLFHWLFVRKDIKNTYSYMWSTLFSRDAGLALLDPVIRVFPWVAGYPKQLEVEVTTHCHLRCEMCEHTYWQEKPRHMTFEEFKRIVDQFPGLRWIGMTGIGSSFLNKEYMRMLIYMKREKKTFVEFFDHFHLMTEDISEQCIELGINKIWVSLENARRESYNKYRKGSDFDSVMRNIWNLVKLKKRMKSPIPELWFHFIINRYNIGEMTDYVDLVAEIADYERGSSAPLIYWTNMLAYEEVSHLAIKPSQKLIQDVEEYCRKKKVFYVFNENVVGNSSMNRCVKWNEPFVLVTGHIQPCCALNEANRRQYQKDNAFMNLFEGDFRDWWKSPERKNYLKTLRSGGLPPVCRYCHIYYHPEGTRFKAASIQ